MAGDEQVRWPLRGAIVVVSYQGERWLRACLASCAQQAVGTPVYVVDNGSTDGSADVVAREFPRVKLLRQVTNLGFAAGNNVGIRTALADGAEAVFLLNQDAELTEGCLVKLEQYLVGHPEVAAVQPGIFLPDGRVNSLGNAYHYLGFGEAGGNGKQLDVARQSLPWIRNRTEPPYLSGAAVLLRAEALHLVGLLDESLFMYHEDLELSLRFRLAGWHLAVEQSARVIHSYEPQRSLRQFYYMERNRFVVWLSYFKLPTLVLLVIPWLVSEVALFIVALFRGWAMVRLRVYLYILQPSTWRDIAVRRRKINALRRVPDRVLLAPAQTGIWSNYKSGFVTRYVFNPFATLVWYLVFPLIRW